MQRDIQPGARKPERRRTDTMEKALQKAEPRSLRLRDTDERIEKSKIRVASAKDLMAAAPKPPKPLTD